MNSRSVGLAVVVIGLVVALVGVGLYTGALSWFGRLPGDLRWESGNTRVYIPFTSMLLLSLALSLLLMLVRRFLT